MPSVFVPGSSQGFLFAHSLQTSPSSHYNYLSNLTITCIWLKTLNTPTSVHQSRYTRRLHPYPATQYVSLTFSHISACVEQEQHLNLDLILRHTSQRVFPAVLQKYKCSATNVVSCSAKSLSVLQSQANTSSTVAWWTWLLISQIAMSENITRKYSLSLLSLTFSLFFP